MKYQSWSKRKFWIVLGVIAFFSWFIGVGMGADTDAQVSETAAKTEVKEVEVKVEDTERFNKLKAVDEEIFALSVKVIDAQSTALTVTGRMLQNYPFISESSIQSTTRTINAQSDIINQATHELDVLQAKRAQIIGD